MRGLAPAEQTLRDTLRATIAPPAPISVSRYLSEHLVLIDGPLAGQPWNAAGAPYLVEIADCLGDDHPSNEVTIRKSQQSGASILALGWCLYVADREPANMLYAVPGLDALRDLNGQKLQPLIDAWQRRMRRTVIEPQTSRSGSGSTTYEKRFAGGYVALGNANSIMDLSSKTTKKGVRDELSKWGLLENGADPETLFFGRFTAFRRTKDYKILNISTPEVDTGDEAGETDGHCRIDRRFKQSDQRYWNVACPACGRLFVHDFARLKVDREHPHRTRYQCHHCPHLITEAERVAAVRAGRWVPMIDEPGRQPGFHIDAFISLLMSYEAIAIDAMNAERGSERDRKDFWNLNLGRPYRFRGDAPDHKRLMERRETDIRRGHVPARGLLLTAAADVQLRGVWLNIIAHAQNGETWVVDALYIEGDTGSPHNPVFDELRAQTLDRTFPDAFGRTRGIDALAVDSGYRSHVVYAWVKTNQRVHPFTGKDQVLAVKGLSGWNPPAIGTPSLQDIDLDGRRLKQGAKLWPVGTWSLKSTIYTNLHKPGIRSGALQDPDGYCHFGMWLDEGYFKQITAEHLSDIIVRGRVTGREWKKTTENHFLDCTVYNAALAEYLGLSTMTPEEWSNLARKRGLPDELSEVDLFTPRRREVMPEGSGEASVPFSAPARPSSAADRTLSLNE